MVETSAVYIALIRTFGEVYQANTITNNYAGETGQFALTSLFLFSRAARQCVPCFKLSSSKRKARNYRLGNQDRGTRDDLKPRNSIDTPVFVKSTPLRRRGHVGRQGFGAPNRWAESFFADTGMHTRKRSAEALVLFCLLRDLLGNVRHALPFP